MKKASSNDNGVLGVASASKLCTKMQNFMKFIKRLGPIQLVGQKFQNKELIVIIPFFFQFTFELDLSLVQFAFLIVESSSI